MFKSICENVKSLPTLMLSSIPKISLLGTVIGLVLLFKYFNKNNALVYFPMAATNISTILMIAFYSVIIAIVTTPFISLAKHEFINEIRTKKESETSFWLILSLSLACLLGILYYPAWMYKIFTLMLFFPLLIYTTRKPPTFKRGTVKRILESEILALTQTMMSGVIFPVVLAFAAILINIPSKNLNEISQSYIIISIFSIITILLAKNLNLKFDTVFKITLLIVMTTILLTPAGESIIDSFIIRKDRRVEPIQEEILKYSKFKNMKKDEADKSMQELFKRENLFWVDENMALIRSENKIIRLPSSHFTDSYITSK